MVLNKINNLSSMKTKMDIHFFIYIKGVGTLNTFRY